MGPVWAFEQFAVDIDQPSVTKSSLYRGPVTRAAVTAVLKAVDRITLASETSSQSPINCASGLQRSHRPRPHVPEMRSLAELQNTCLWWSRMSRTTRVQPGASRPAELDVDDA